MPVKFRKTPISKSEPILFTLQPRLLTIKQAAIYLNRSVWRIRQMIHLKELKTVGRERPFVLDRNDLDQWIEQAKAA
jgi:excisionase family DNA binding protein